MANKKRTILALTLIAVGASGLFGLRALASPGASLPPLTSAAAAPGSTLASPAAVATQTADTQAADPALKDRMREMLKERMGLTGPEADKLVDSMSEHMQAVYGDQADAMLNYCAGRAGSQSSRGTDATPGSTGWNGMMGGSGRGMMGSSGYGYGMMGSGI